MKLMTYLKKYASGLLCFVLIAAMALTMVSCKEQPSDSQSSAGTDLESSEAGENSAVESDVRRVGEGATVFTFTVVDGESQTTVFEVSTDETTVGAALLKVGLIAGEDSEYGLYVKTVNGITADYDKDGTYWAFYVNDDYASTGVDSTAIQVGDSYAFKVSK